MPDTKKALTHNKRLLLVIPTYQEKENLLDTLSKSLSILKKQPLDSHILVVDDNSPDDTASLVTNFIKSHPSVHLIVRPKKMGLGSAYRDAFRWARDNLPSDYYVQMDADRSHPPEALPWLIEPLISSYDVVLASRYVSSGGSSEWSLLRRIISIFTNRALSLMLRFRIGDWTSGYRALRAIAVDRLLESKVITSGYEYQVQSLLTYILNDCRILEVPYIFGERARGRSKLGPRAMAKFAKGILPLLIQRRSRPV